MQHVIHHFKADILKLSFCCECLCLGFANAKPSSYVPGELLDCSDAAGGDTM
jgi:hypothetical protein